MNKSINHLFDTQNPRDIKLNEAFRTIEASHPELFGDNAPSGLKSINHHVFIQYQSIDSASMTFVYLELPEDVREEIWDAFNAAYPSSSGDPDTSEYKT